jgi:hypothetical protein
VQFVMRILAPLAIMSGGPLAAQQAGEIQLPRLTDPPACDEGPDGEVIVCGRRRPDERYRIRPELREDRTNPVNPSWSARARDDRETARYGSQAVGPAGAFSRSREVDCQWRAERQQIAGHPPDCTRKVRRPGN